MDANRIKDSLNYQTCLCCMCRCVDHKCFQQQALKLPPSMQKELVYDNKDVLKEGDKKDSRQADLYRKTMYRLDYCDQQDAIDRFPLEQPRHRDSMTFISTFGRPLHDSTYKDDFIPWSIRDQELCRAKLHVPDRMLKGDFSDDRCGDVPRYPTKDEHNYYCPPHCRGSEEPEKKENCFLGHERQFNLGPPVRRTCPAVEKSHHPFAKYSNYMLDYKGGKVPPKRKLLKRDMGIDNSVDPVSSETTYRDAFICPPEMIHKPRKKEGQVDSLTVGDGPMVQQTTSMLDYTDPDVCLHKPTRPPRQVYQPPACSMETTTTTGSTYQRWKYLPAQVKHKTRTDENDSFKLPETDVRPLITTYQEDFDGINSALCPCRVVEKYGRRVLEPKYKYEESNKLHDIFCYTNDCELKYENCLHA